MKNATTDKNGSKGQNNGSKGQNNDLRTKEVDSKAMGKGKDSQAKEMEVSSHNKSGKEASQTQNTDAQKLSSKGSTHQVIPRGTLLVSAQVLSSLNEACTWLHTCVIGMPDEGTMKVDLDKSQFHYMWDPSTYVTRGDVREFFSEEMLCVSIIQAFMRALYEDLMGCESVSKVWWFCPEEICDSKCLGNQPELREYLRRSLRESSIAGDKFIMAPYRQDMHWTLLVICPSSYTVYEFDSVNREQPRNLLITALLNSEMRKLRDRSSNPRWKSVRCARQENGVECGYYVMRYMYDLVSSCSEVDDLEKVFNTPREGPFTVKEIDEVRDKLALFLTNNCV